MFDVMECSRMPAVETYTMQDIHEVEEGLATDKDAIEHIFGTLLKSKSSDNIFKACALQFRWDINDENIFDIEEFTRSDIKTLESIRLPSKQLLKPFQYGKL